MNSQQGKDILLLNLAMLFISTSGVLGRSIEMSPEITIFWRATLAALLLSVLCFGLRIRLFENLKGNIGVFFWGGFLMAVHWVAYFYALQWSNVAIGMLSLFTYPVLTSLLEPLLLGTKFQKIHLFLGLLTLVGIYFLVPDVDFSSDNFKAVGLGTLSSIAYSFRNILMKKSIQEHNGSKLMFFQTLVIAMVLLPFAAVQGFGDIAAYWKSILFLALFTTVIGHTLFLMSFKHFSVTSASIMSCSQPIYGILLGVVFLGEYPVWTTYIGGSLILLSVVIESVMANEVSEVSEF